jgi:mRNA degradation ribonuclease J1/J2
MQYVCLCKQLYFKFIALLQIYKFLLHVSEHVSHKGHVCTLSVLVPAYVIPFTLWTTLLLVTLTFV